MATLVDLRNEASERALSLALGPLHRALRVVLSPGSFVAADVDALAPRLRSPLLEMASQSNSFTRWIAK